MTASTRVAIVTGAGSGIGAAVAVRLAQDGFHVAVAELRPEAAEATVTQITTAGGSAHAVQVDVASEASVRAMVEAVLSRGGRIDALVNNAGIAGQSALS